MNHFKVSIFILLLFVSIPFAPKVETVNNNFINIQYKRSSLEKETYIVTGVFPFDYFISQKANLLEISIPNVSTIDTSSLSEVSSLIKEQTKFDKKKVATLSFQLTNYPYHFLHYYFSYKTLVIELRKQPQNRLYKKVIVLDPGHGAYSDEKELWEYYDCGAIGKTGIYESVINLSISKLIKKKLVENGAQVIMTRENEKDRNSLRFEQRGDLVNDVLPDLFLSIHQNTSIDTSAHGSVLYYSNPIAFKLVSYISKEMLKDTKIPLRSLFNGKFEIIEKMNIQAKTLIECGFLSNPYEENYLLKEENQEKIASAIVTGIINFFEN